MPIVNGISTNYICEGNGDTILVLPGWSAPSATYNMIVKQLSSKYRVIVLDLPGFSITPEPQEPWTVDDFTDFVIEFAKEMGIKKTSLIGHSYGGRIIIKLANRDLPFEIDKIALVDSAGIKSTPSEEQKKKQAKYNRLKKIYSSGIVKKVSPDAMEKLRKKYGSSDYANASPVMRQCLVKAVNEDLTDLIPAIKQETLLIWGRNDTATPYADAVKMSKLIKNSKLKVIDDAGHFPFLDQPFEFNKILCDYFK